jgi:hypothetical protein
MPVVPFQKPMNCADNSQLSKLNSCQPSMVSASLPRVSPVAIKAMRLEHERPELAPVLESLLDDWLNMGPRRG